MRNREIYKAVYGKDYAIYRVTYDVAKELFPNLKLKEGYIPTYIYVGFRNELYVGYMAGSFENMSTVNIQCTQLVPEFRGEKVVKIIRDIVNTIHKDFKYIKMSIDGTRKSMTKILLNAGFNIIGTQTYAGIVFLTLLKTDG